MSLFIFKIILLFCKRLFMRERGRGHTSEEGFGVAEGEGEYLGQTPC